MTIFDVLSQWPLPDSLDRFEFAIGLIFFNDENRSVYRKESVGNAIRLNAANFNVIHSDLINFN